MNIEGLLHLYEAYPTLLHPAPPYPVTANQYDRRIAAGQPCVYCGQPATNTLVINHRNAGRKWLDLCTSHHIQIRAHITKHTTAKNGAESEGDG